MTLKLCLLIIYFLFTNSIFEAESIKRQEFIKTEDYLMVQIDDRRVFIHPEIKNSPVKKDLLDLLRVKLFDVKRVLPKVSYEKIKDVSIWVDNGDFGCPGACYHPSKIWLTENGLNPDKEKSIQIGNPENFLEWTKQQPFMVLHELAHAYHHQFLGYQNEDVNRAYEKALKSGSYEEVLHWNGNITRHYGLNNSQEYFAEATEAYFGVNDFYPFVRGELKVHDYEMYTLVNKLWNPVDSEEQ